jgi:starch synthase
VKVVFVSSEVAPFAKTGGLADVCAALPTVLAEMGHEISVVTPLYATTPRSGLTRLFEGLPVPQGSDRIHADVWEGRLGKARVFLLDPPGFFERPFLYGPASGEYADNPYRFAFLSRGALALAEELGLTPDVFHAHDWQTGLLPLYLRRNLSESPLQHAATVFTVHNLGYQGNFPPEVLIPLSLGTDLWGPEGIEFYGSVSFLKSGILFADRLSTVSPTYAREIQTPEFGHGLDGFVRAYEGKLRGILNGIDAQTWNPIADPNIPAPFSEGDLSGKRICKARFQEAMGLPRRPQTPLVTIVSRLVEQKGWDLFADIANAFLEDDVQLTVLGTGTPTLEGFFRSLETRYPHQVAVRLGFDEGQAHRAQAGADLLLMPSRYEPCGLTQMYALRYGTVPVVRATGGLRDSIVDVDLHPLAGTGFQFEGYDSRALLARLRHALSLYRNRAQWERVVRRGMAQDFSWKRAATEYTDLYEAAVRERP